MLKSTCLFYCVYFFIRISFENKQKNQKIKNQKIKKPNSRDKDGIQREEERSFLKERKDRKGKRKEKERNRKKSGSQ